MICGIIKIMPEAEKNESKINRLEKRLYRKEFIDNPDRISDFKKREYRVKNEWMSKEPPMSTRKKIKLVKKRMSAIKILVASVIFFIVSAGIAFFIISNGSNVFSLKKVDVNIAGPVAVKGGEKFVLNIDVTNNNDTAMEFADLIIKYPNGFYSSFDSQNELSVVRESLGKINPKETVKRKLSLVLFGSGNSKKSISFTLESRFAGSSATLDKTENYDILLASSSVNLSVATPKKIGAKQEFETTISIGSNSNITLKNLILKVDYPTGFTFTGSTPTPFDGENIWKIGDLSPSDKRVIKIKGMITGQEDSRKIFTVSVGSKDLKDSSSIATVYNSVTEEVGISKPFLGLSVLVNGTETPEYISKSTRALRVDILWKSNSSIKITDGEIKVKLDGGIVDRFSVYPDKGGFYKSLDNTIVWNSRTGEDGLSLIEPGESGKVGFTLQSLPLVDSSGRVFKNPKITISVDANGNQATDEGVESRLHTSVSRGIKIESMLKISPRAVYYTGPFSNTGPLPPKVDSETTYTVILSTTNTSNKISSAVAKTTLPTYVKWLGVVSPQGEDVSFNEVDGEVTWNIGDIDAGTGFISGAREVAFKVGLIPSASQANKVVPITGEITISGKDTSTGTILGDIERRLDTNLSSDPSFSIKQAYISK